VPKEIAVNAVSARVARPLFQDEVHVENTSHSPAGMPERGGSSLDDGLAGGALKHDHKMGNQKDISKELVDGVKDMHVAGDQIKGSYDAGSMGGTDRVSFGTNMSTKGETSECESIKQETKYMDEVVAKLQARKAAAKAESVRIKKGVLKAQGQGCKKKQKTPVKTSLQGGEGGVDAMQDVGHD
jgi:hypothetical protein